MPEPGNNLFQPFWGLPLQEMKFAEKNLKRLERRDWWLWWTAITVMLLLTATLIVISLPSILEESNWTGRWNLNLAVHALVGLVLLFNVYTIIPAVADQAAAARGRAAFVDTPAAQGLRGGISTAGDARSADLLFKPEAGGRTSAGEVSRSQRYGHALSVLMLDLNHFKEINDRYGHAAGDLVLRTFTERLVKVIRPSDLGVWLGGDEFLVILPECPPDKIPSLLDRLSSLAVQYEGKKTDVTNAAGWAGYLPKDTPQMFMERADKVLYLSKRMGRGPPVGPSLASKP